MSLKDQMRRIEEEKDELQLAEIMKSQRHSRISI
jgi:hypothetical protein